MIKKLKKKNRSTFCLRLDENLHSFLKSTAITLGVTMNDILEQYVLYLKQHRGRAKYIVTPKFDVEYLKIHEEMKNLQEQHNDTNISNTIH